MSMKKWKKILIAVIGVLAITTANAKQNACRQNGSLPPGGKCPPCCEIPGGPTISAYNYPANINVRECWDVFVNAAFLWILPCMDQLEFAQTSYPSVSTSIGTVHEFKYDWKPAFKVGAGYNIDYDNWDVYIQFLRINVSMSNTHHAGTNAGESLNGTLEQRMTLSATGDNQLLSRDKGKWHLDFNMFNLEFGRPFYNGKCLQFRGHYGLKAGWIDNSFKQNIINSTGVHEEGYISSKSWLIGPRTGVDTKWIVRNGFRFFGNAAASLFYQKFYDTRLGEIYTSNPQQWYIAANYTVKHITSCLESILGFGWGSHFAKNKWYFDLAIGYEAQLFFNQNQMARMKNFINLKDKVNPVSKAGNFYFHGLNATMQFNF